MNQNNYEKKKKALEKELLSAQGMQQTNPNDATAVKQQAATPAQTQKSATATNQNANMGTSQVNPSVSREATTSNSQQQNTAQPPVYSYDKNADYSKKINDAVAAGNYMQAAIYEQQRNAKIASEGLQYEQSNTYVDYLPGGSKYGTVGINENDMSPMINQMYNAQAQQITNEVNQQVQSSVDQLNRAWEEAQPTYEAAIANQLLETKQAQDAQALRNQLNGDRGGIGSAQVSSIGNTGAKNREAIAQQQRQLATDTARQIADLRAQGKFQEANLLLQNNQQKLSALYEEQVRMQQYEAEQKNVLASMGSQYLSAGIMPNEAMLSAMGIDAQTAQSYIDMQKNQNLANLGSQYLSAGVMPSDEMLAAMGIDAQTAQSYVNNVKSGGDGGTYYYEDTNPVFDAENFEALSSDDKLGDVAKTFLRTSGKLDDYFPALAQSYLSGNITLEELTYVVHRKNPDYKNDVETAKVYYDLIISGEWKTEEEDAEEDE